MSEPTQPRRKRRKKPRAVVDAPNNPVGGWLQLKLRSLAADLLLLVVVIGVPLALVYQTELGRTTLQWAWHAAWRAMDRTGPAAPAPTGAAPNDQAAAEATGGERAPGATRTDAGKRDADPIAAQLMHVEAMPIDVRLEMTEAEFLRVARGWRKNPVRIQGYYTAYHPPEARGSTYPFIALDPAGRVGQLTFSLGPDVTERLDTDAGHLAVMDALRGYAPRLDPPRMRRFEVVETLGGKPFRKTTHYAQPAPRALVVVFPRGIMGLEKVHLLSSARFADTTAHEQDYDVKTQLEEIVRFLGG